jgi:hypothetical protein
MKERRRFLSLPSIPMVPLHFKNSIYGGHHWACVVGDEGGSFVNGCLILTLIIPCESHRSRYLKKCFGRQAKQETVRDVPAVLRSIVASNKNPIDLFDSMRKIQ